MDALIQDLRYGLRSLARHRSFTLVAVLSLALGIGANTAMFSLLDALLLRPLPLPDPQSLVRVLAVNPDGSTAADFSYPEYEALRDRSSTLSSLAGYAPSEVTFTSDRPPARLVGEQVTGNYFAMLGARPARGRLLGAGDDRRGVTPSVVLSHRLWRTRFGGEDDLVGATLTLDGRTFTVAGIASADFNGMARGSRPDFWIPVAVGTDLERARMGFSQDMLSARTMRWMALVGRAAGGLERAAIESELDAVARTFPDAPPVQTGSRMLALPGSHGDPYLLAHLSRIGVILMAVVVMVLLLASANVANLLLARATGRRREIAVRLAVGGSRGRIVRQLLTESVLVAAIGGIAGLLLATWSLELLRGVQASSFQAVALDLRLDGRVLAFTSVLSLLTGVLFGLVPALQASRPALVPSLKGEEAGRGTWRSRLRAGLIVGQVAISLALLVGSGLFVRSLRNLQSVDLGYDPRPLWTAPVQLGPNVQRERARQFYAALLERVQNLPGVKAASLASIITPNPGGMNIGMPASDLGLQGSELFSIDVNNISPGYFRTTQLPIVRGREFVAADTLGGRRTVIVNQTLARRLFGNEDPVGRSFTLFGPDDQAFLVVGVAKDSRYRSLTETTPNYAYLPIGTMRVRSMSLMIRGGSPAILAEEVRRIAQQLDPDVPVSEIQPLEQRLARVLAPARLSALVITLFGVLALLIAAVGIYGMFSYMVGQRTHEIGVRMALGAKQADVLGLVLGHGLRVVAAGVAIGAALALGGGRLVASQLYGVAPADGLALALAPLVLVPVAMLACLLPAHRATRVDPVVALRHE